jgi:creatinine amidohydrolase
MEWAKLTGPQLETACESCGGLAVLPLGSLERHGTHLPCGTDGLNVAALCAAAAEIEPAVVLPTLFYTHVHEMRNNVGAVSLSGRHLIGLIERLCDEIARNGFRKIALVNGHGGNRFWLPQLMIDLCGADKGYATFLVRIRRDEQIERLREATVPEAHAGEMETSEALHLFGDCVDMSAVPADHQAGARKPVPDVPAYTPIEWYSWYPEAYAGDALYATVEKGKASFENRVQSLARAFAELKANTHVLEHIERFNREKRHG